MTQQFTEAMVTDLAEILDVEFKPLPRYRHGEPCHNSFPLYRCPHKATKVAQSAEAAIACCDDPCCMIAMAIYSHGFVYRRARPDPSPADIAVGRALVTSEMKSRHGAA